jgi:hypothetical protein
MKKWLVWILLLITTVGTFVPCCSLDDCCTAEVAGTINHNKHKDEGTCSPFFACATCPGFIELTKPIQLNFPETENLIHHQSIVKLSLPTYSSSFWQPPRCC